MTFESILLLYIAVGLVIDLSTRTVLIINQMSKIC